ncbi:copper resistance protein CopD [Arthrobacter sp. MYb211]|uniref:cytochrome c oxidase assembly protein n=1 Tax=unclassified Arthrobacter TaxID=235627 RepID=UPI000CFB5109|nr:MULTISPECIES: cytochrome c oxidase assembly protein [unclassified Arthrobacter]PRA11335.1 copper resistance protein CopD [Arthrobacter sp. MYb221]PRC07490.1 copper resistance protein CopD [Arthrobacter sp. MYb211]
MATQTPKPPATRSAPQQPSISRYLLPAIPVMALVFLGAALFTGIAAPSQLADPGAFVRWALPISRAIHHSSMAITIAALIFAAVILPRSTKIRRPSVDDARVEVGQSHPAFNRAMNIAAGAGVVWTLAAATVLLLTFWDLAGVPMNLDASYTAAILDYILQLATGRAWAWMIVIAAITSSLALAIRSHTGVGLAAVFSLFGIVPMAFIGHAAGGDDHYGAVNSIALHLLAVVIWFGGIVVLALLSPTLTSAAPGRFESRPVLAGLVLKRFSALATVAIVLMVGSGLASATIRITELDQWLSSYGLVVIAKVVLTLVLGFLGFMHRRHVIPQLLAGKLTTLNAAWRVVLAELILMGATMSLATVLARTAPPTDDQPPVEATPARLLTGYELPAPPTTASWLTVWRLDWLWVAVCFFLLAFYLWAFILLRRRGDKPSFPRLFSWIIGLVVLFYITSGALAVYGKVQFSVHMVDHMSLTMIAPIFLVLGTPITLALQVLGSRTDGTRGPREWILWAVHSKYSAVVTHPIFAAVMFAGSIVVFYFTPILEIAMKYHAGHELMNVHFLLTGYIFALSLVDADPIPKRYPYPMRLIVLLATVAFHAFFGVALMGNENLLAPDWYGNMGRTWGGTAMEDQVVGAGAMWAIGEVPTLVLAMFVVVSWLRQDKKDTKRYDRQADRDGDAELAAYNEMFAKMKQQDTKGEYRGR